MVFSSHIFLFVFLPLFLLVYYAVNPRLRSTVIVIGSWTFYGWWRIDFLLLYFAVTVWSYVFGQKIAAAPTREARKIWCIVGVVGSLLVLAYFKYFNFLLDSVLAVTGDDLRSADVFWTVILPIGISFFVFESISYMVDIYRRDASPARNFMDFAAFLALFPHLIAGPVMRYKDLNAQIVHRTHSWAKFSEGSVYFMLGLSKKILIADSIAPMVDTIFSHDSPTFMEAWLGVVAYTVQLYFDFSGYSDMAVGLGLMIGFRLVHNFNHPYVSRSITEFWRRWHISLSNWLRDYLYFVLGGNRKGKIRTYVNLTMTMLLGGLWHGASWNFVLWGAWHGVILAFERAIGGTAQRTPYPSLIAMPLTLLLVMIGWVLFRAPDLASAVDMYRGLLGLQGFRISPDVAWRLRSLELLVLALAVALVFMAPRMKLRHWAAELPVVPVRWATVGNAVLVGLSFAAVLKLAADSYSPFLYFQF
jgi:alginate O-acetyltransferase complex protein AlgI